MMFSEREPSEMNIEDLRRERQSGTFDLSNFLEILTTNFQQGKYKPEDLTVHELEYFKNRGVMTIDQYQNYCRDKIRRILEEGEKKLCQICPEKQIRAFIFTHLTKCKVYFTIGNRYY